METDLRRQSSMCVDLMFQSRSGEPAAARIAAGAGQCSEKQETWKGSGRGRSGGGEAEPLFLSPSATTASEDSLETKVSLSLGTTYFFFS